MFIEYPKALYIDGVASSYEETPYRVVHNAEEEEFANSEGWFEIGKAPSVDQEQDEPIKPVQETRRGRPRKEQ